MKVFKELMELLIVVIFQKLIGHALKGWNLLNVNYTSIF